MLFISFKRFQYVRNAPLRYEFRLQVAVMSDHGRVVLDENVTILLFTRSTILGLIDNNYNVYVET